MKTLTGKQALVTGAASGIGRAIALQLARHGVDLFLVDIDEAGLHEVSDEARELGVRVVGRLCDLACRDDISRMTADAVQCHGGVDILINNAGVGYYGPTDNMTARQWDWLLQINLHAPIQITRELLPSLLARGEAHVLNVSSICGLAITGGRVAAYHTTKHALVGFTQSLRAEFTRKGIGVTCLCPGYVRTKLYESAANGRTDRPVPVPPAWICTTAERIAAKGVTAIRKNRGLVLVSPLAYALWYTNRAAPWLFDLAFTLGKKRRPQATPAVDCEPEHPRRAA